MIRVELQPEPLEFNDRVREPGLRYLSKGANPTQREWQRHNYWTRIGKKLHSSYGGVCSYSCHWIAYDTGWRTVEHFLPKTLYPHLAYEWSNYRLVSGILNGRKGDRTVLDPLTIEDGWFVIKFPSLLVVPSPDLSEELSGKVRNTCDTLGLNDEDTCMKSRAKYIEAYCKYQISYSHLLAEAPFLARELDRQGLVENIRAIMMYGTAS